MFPESAETKTKKPISDMQFFPPVKGLISSRFDLSLGHFGCDIVGAQDETIHSILDGTVVLASWTIEAGYILQIQHDNNFISIYKHMREKLVEQGSHINAGDPVAIIGGSGEFSTGPHLHFELWYNGTPLDPEDYIIF
ncbi:MAG: M23 family metallopeptidase [Bacteroidia bacterium]|nr:M23 family metallopeptidase [Bacteroidia bacterium]